jgi:hypothetical protein
MAFDTLADRFSALAVYPWMPKMPWPDGVIDQGDRQQVAGIYRAIAASAPTFGVSGGWLRLGHRDRYDYSKTGRLGL